MGYGVKRCLIGQPGQHVLDVATGTGIVAIAAAEIVGFEGKVIGVDFTPGILGRVCKVRNLTVGAKHLYLDVWLKL